MRVAVLACTRRVRCCEEEWQAAQRAHWGRAGRHWCAGPWCGQIGTPAGAAGGAAWVPTLPRQAASRGLPTATQPRRARADDSSPPRPGARRDCGCGGGLGRGRRIRPRPAWVALPLDSRRSTAAPRAAHLAPVGGPPGHYEGRGVGAATGPPGRRARAAETPGAAREARARAVCQSTIGGAASGRQGPPGGRSRATLASTATSGVAGSEDPI
jgi:hypothetical protein